MAMKSRAIRSEVERICSSRGFENADRLKDLLRYTVEKTLAGSASEIKEYTLGVDVFGRGDGFDPKTDSLVRVTAGKLRLRLKEYYANNPTSQIRIEFPPGSYTPVFVEQDITSDHYTQPHTGRRWMRWTGPAAALLALAGTISWMSASRRPTRKIMKKITADAAIARDAAISPDGKLVVYSSNRDSGNFQLYLQLVDGGPPLKLPDIKGSASSPDFSPDGTVVAFVQHPPKEETANEPQPPGVYLTPTLGGSPSRIADGDGSPRFSPDGQTIVFSKSPNRIYLVSRKGGVAKQISPDHFQAASSPVFTPDGKYVLFFGRPSGIDDKGRDWWLVSLRDETLVQTGVKSLVREVEKLPDSPFYCYPSGWLDGKVLFWCDFGERSNLFTASIQMATWKITGPVERVTFGAGGHEQRPSTSDTGRIVFTSTARSTDLHALPFDPSHSGEVQRDTRQITRHGAGGIHHVMVAPGGRRMSYSVKALRREVWTRDLLTGRESMLSSGRVFRSAISPDGTQVAYHEPRDDGSRIVVAPVSGGAPRVVCENCKLVEGWTPDGSHILWGHDNYRGLFAADLKTGAQQIWIDSKRHVQAGGFSPDGKWLSLSNLAFNGGTPAGYVIPIHNGRPASESQWVFVKKGPEQMQWSPDGAALYYLSAQDGHLCLYAQRLNPVTKHPLGDRFAVYHLHSPERSLFGSWMIPFNFALTRDDVYLTIEREQSNIWMLH